jgi:GTP-binding protein EngB required for normal cell division
MSGSAMNVSLKKFDMRRIQQDAVCVFIGRRRTGKSTLLKDLLYNHQDMPLGTVISGTEESNGFYSK